MQQEPLLSRKDADACARLQKCDADHTAHQPKSTLFRCHRLGFSMQDQHSKMLLRQDYPETWVALETLFPRRSRQSHGVDVLARTVDLASRSERIRGFRRYGGLQQDLQRVRTGKEAVGVRAQGHRPPLLYQWRGGKEGTGSTRREESPSDAQVLGHLLPQEAMQALPQLWRHVLIMHRAGHSLSLLEGLQERGAWRTPLKVCCKPALELGRQFPIHIVTQQVDHLSTRQHVPAEEPPHRCFPFACCLRGVVLRYPRHFFDILVDEMVR